MFFHAGLSAVVAALAIVSLYPSLNGLGAQVRAVSVGFAYALANAGGSADCVALGSKDATGLCAESLLTSPATWFGLRPGGFQS